MGKLLAALVLMGLALIVTVAAIIHFATGGDLDREEHRPILHTAPKPDLPEGDRVVVTLGGGRSVAEPATAPGTTPREPELKPGDLTVKERQNVDSRGYLIHTVQAGDTLYKLSARHLGDPQLANTLLRHNPELSRAEDLREGMQLRIPLWLRKPDSRQPTQR
jgi:hypothetical protein